MEEGFSALFLGECFSQQSQVVNVEQSAHRFECFSTKLFLLKGRFNAELVEEGYDFADLAICGVIIKRPSGFISGGLDGDQDNVNLDYLSLFYLGSISIPVYTV